ncbi:MAG TPA: efflux RND transporter periplasmic adaptor subunit [Bryobacteraceae bacterium]|nr:efflux RND transporter periplasmic adaptor subunit [Bryobacteraceae bacterium]
MFSNRMASGLGAAGLIMAAACGSREPHRAEAAAPAPMPVKTVLVESTEWPAVYEAVGTVRARTSARVAARVMGYIREMHVRAGDSVRAGQLVAVIDARDLEAAWQQAAAALEEARGGIAEADNAVAAARAQLDLAQVTFRRMDDLFRKRSISNQEYDDARARLNVAQAGYEMARAKRTQLDSRIRQSEQGVRAAEVARGYAQIHAPFGGVVTEKHLDAGDMATPGAPLITIEQTGAFQLEVPVEEARLGSIRVGQAASVRLDAFGTSIAARVSEIVPAVDAASRTFTAKLALPPDPRLRSGLFGRAEFPLSSERVIAAPMSSVTERGQLRTIYVIEGHTARARLVTLGRQRGGMIEVLTGLSAGEKIVAPVPAGIVDGRRVEVRS